MPWVNILYFQNSRITHYGPFYHEMIKPIVWAFLENVLIIEGMKRKSKVRGLSRRRKAWISVLRSPGTK